MRRDWLPLGCLVVLALGLRLLYLSEIRLLPSFHTPNPILDAALYDRIARNIASGQWLGGPEARYTGNPLYAYFLAVWYALFGPSWLIPRVVQLLLGALTPLLLYLIGRRAFGRPVGLLAAFMGAIYGPLIFDEGLILTSSLTPLATCLVLLALLVAQQRGLGRDWLLAGAAVGLLTLLRHNSGILLPAAFGWALLVGERGEFRPRIRRGLLLLLGAGLALLPMTARSLAADRDPALLSSLGGIHFYIGNHTGASGGYTPVSGVEDSPRGHVEDATRVAEQALGRQLTPSAVSGYWYRKGLQFIREEPGQFLRLLGRKLLLALNGEELTYNENDYYRIRRKAAVLRLPLLTFAVVGPLGLLGLLLSLKRWREIGILHLAFFAYLGSLLLFFVSGIYRVPLIPPLLVFAAFALRWGYERAVEDARLPLVAAAAALVVLTLLTQTTVAIIEPKAPSKAGRAENEVSAQRWREARVAQLEERATSAPDDHRVHLRLADLYSSQGKTEKAVHEFERAAALAPTKEEALDVRVRLALSLENAKHHQEAKRRWEEVVAMRPPPGIAELARRHLIRVEQALRSGASPAALEKGARQ